MKITTFFFIPILLHFSISSLVAMAEVTNITTDQTSLLAFKANITKDPNNILSNWSTTTSVCNWVGIACGNKHTRVTALNLSYMSLTGTISPQLGNLTFLSYLTLDNNSFHGRLPQELLQLHRLKQISFKFNGFKEEIPSWFGLFPKLEVIDISYNSFNGSIPTSLCNISSLIGLDLSYNDLSGTLPSNIFNIPSLRGIDVSNNRLSGSISSHVFNGSDLRFIDLWSNDFNSNLPQDVCKYVPNLEVLALFQNQFTGKIPPSIFNCKNLRILSLNDNRLMGNIPREIGNSTMLQNIVLSQNNFQGTIPEEIGSLVNLEIFSIQFSNISGSIPLSLFNSSTIKRITLNDNHLSGKLPSTLGLAVPSLEILRLYINNLSGPIPTCLSNASMLTELDLSENSFSGYIPTTLGNLRNLEWLNLDDNNLSIEARKTFNSLSSCKHLTLLSLSSNPFNIILPDSVGNLSTSLQYFRAHNCSLMSRIPASIGNLTGLIYFRLTYNKLTGEIPTAMGNLRRLQGVYLDYNEIQGDIPYELCEMKRLESLYLSRNKITWRIPPCLGNMTSLRQLSLRSNRLNYTVPSSLFGLEKSLVNLSLAGNHFEGHIPESLGNLGSLELLDLSRNNLSGSIPKSLELLPYFRYFNVSFNKLQGEIPSEGPFTNFTAQSYVANEALCGAPRLQVPECKAHASSHSKSTPEIMLKYVLPIAVAVVVLVLVVILLIYVIVKGKRKSVNILEEDMTELGMTRRTSYYELQRATNRFSEDNLLGAGSFSKVYKGRISDGIDVAVKVFNLQVEEAKKSFDAECEVMYNVRHRNLVKIISSCSNSNFKALVLTYMPLGSLEKWLHCDGYCLNFLQRLNIMIDIAAGLEYLHHGYLTRIVHCDLKPNNILLDEDMVAHVADFGIAKLLGGGESITQTLTLATIGYMAPEYGLEGIVSMRSDVYSFGILLMETFTRRKPTDEMFSGELSLKMWVEKSYAHSIADVVDATLLTGDEEKLAIVEKGLLSSIFVLALGCSSELPDGRPSIKDVLVALNKIKMDFLNQ